MFNGTFLHRFGIAVILLAHSIPGIFDNGINDFGNLYLNQIGFAPLGVPIAWAIKLSHLVAALCLFFEKYVKWACAVTILILIAGIVLVHYPEGWFVVGGGRNGVEFNFILIIALLTIMFPDGFRKEPILIA
ncbi:putative oxidoreductase [Spirosomataceae bacterium TFI 002]|nr:putative oxidoreductase [Spirosomataceae bacterium TFI 002]